MDVETVATYDRIAGRFAEQWWSTRLTAHMDRFASAVGAGAGAGGVVVDLGCGPGRDVAWLEELGFASVGVDASFGMLAEARRRVGASAALVRGDLVALPLASGTVGGAWMCASLLHLTVEESAWALAEVARVVAGGGALFVSVQAGSGMGTKSSPSGDRRFTFWDADRLAGAVSAAGFVVRAAETAPPDPATGVSWVGLHAVRSGGDC